jgi:hypothetical protein
MFDGFGDLEMCNVFHPEEKVLATLWELQGFWEQGDIGH